MTPDEMRRALADLAAQSSKSTRAAGEIQKQAAARRAAVQSRLDELRPKSITDDAADDEYQDLVLEQGRLDRVLSS